MGIKEYFVTDIKEEKLKKLQNNKKVHFKSASRKNNKYKNNESIS